MNKVKPSGYDITLIYECDKCNAEHSATLEETEFPAGILCFCGAKIKLETVEDVSVKCSFKDVSAKQPTSNIKVDEKHGMGYNMVEYLCGLGIPRSEAKSMVKEVISSEPDIEEQELLEKCMSLVGGVK